MPKLSQCKVRFLACLTIVLVAGECLWGQEDSPELIWPELLRHARVQIVWKAKLPIQDQETLEKLFLINNRIYALSSSNYMVCMDRNKGSFMFGKNIAPKGYTVFGFEQYGEGLVLVVGNRLVEIDPASGEELRSMRPVHGITCPAARNSSFFYVAGADARLRVYRAQDRVHLFDIRTENDSPISSVIADDQLVVFATEAGNIVSMLPDQRKQLWKVQAGDSIIGPIIRSEEAIFAASRDTYVYRIDANTGEWTWRYQTAALLDKAPRVTNEVVYQYVHSKGLTAIDKTEGSFMWQVEKGVELLAEANRKAYVITADGELVVMDNHRRSRHYCVNFSSVNRYACNTTDSKMYVADDTGRIMCLEPLQ